MISVIIPTLNEEETIRETLASLRRESAEIEIIVADGGSTDRTRETVHSFAGVQWIETEPGRARQMNAGAAAALGDLLLFLHADTLLVSGWSAEVQRAVNMPNFAVGAFRFSIGQSGRAYRVVEWGVRWRCRLFHLPYGDQGLFVRAKDFRDAGGFRDMPILEDVDFVRRMRNRGRVVIAEMPAVTSSRRWERHGVARQTWMNWTTYTLYRMGRPLDQIARRYRTVSRRVIMFCKYPEPGTVKTRLAASLGKEGASRVYKAMVLRTLKAVDAIRVRTELIIQYSPEDSESAFRHWLGSARTYTSQGDGDLGERMLRAFQQSAASGVHQTVLVGADCPGLSRDGLHRAFECLDEHDVVLGPATDGGYYLIGASRPHPALFHGIEWSTEAVFADTLAACADHGLTVAQLEPLRDVDTMDDLEACAKMLKWRTGRID